ncbi:MAG: MarR family transcriptional regulator [Pseudomonadota bacterium]
MKEPINTPDALSLVRLLEVFEPAYRRFMGTGLPPGVSAARLRMLGLLADRGPMTMTDLCRASDVTPQNITGLVDALEREGAVTRVVHPTDRRKRMIALSDVSRSEVLAQLSAHRAHLARLFEELAPREKAGFAYVLKGLIERLEEGRAPATDEPSSKIGSFPHHG